MARLRCMARSRAASGARQRGCLPRRIGRDQAHDGRVHLVRDLQHMPVGEAALDRVAVQQRRRCRTAQHQGQLPGDVGGVHAGAVFRPSPANGLDRWPASPSRNRRPSARRGHDALVHPEAGGPADIVDAGVPAHALVHQARQLPFVRCGCRRLVDVHEHDPALVRQRRHAARSRPGRNGSSLRRAGSAGRRGHRPR